MVQEQLEEVRQNIRNACERSGRKVEDVTLIAVSKTKPVPMLQEAYDAGARDFGENKVQEILEKEPQLPSDIRWHMIGHLQKNKVRQVIDKAVLIHSVDTVGLAEQIEKEAVKHSMFTGSDGNLYGRLDLDRYMIQFESERFMNFEISSEETQGLKIPVSSVMEKEFYTIPVDYMTTGGNATEDEAGFNKEVYGEGGKASIEFVTPEIYSSTDEYYYVEKSDDGLLKSGDYLVKPDSNERFQVGPTAKLTGAYNINKGYAVFKQVKELANSGEYYIVEKGTKYGLSVYDHIVLDASTVSDGQIVYQ